MNPLILNFPASAWERLRRLGIEHPEAWATSALLIALRQREMRSRTVHTERGAKVYHRLVQIREDQAAAQADDS